MTGAATYHIPDDRWYDRASHMWARLEPVTGRVLVGIDTLGLAALGDLAYISLQAVGGLVHRGEAIGAFEAAKMTGDVVTPVSGTLVERNEAALRDPLLVNSDPYGQGWLVAVEPTDWEHESAVLIAGEALPSWVAAEVERYRAQGWID
jgi:glycine cleavage system H protein